MTKVPVDKDGNERECLRCSKLIYNQREYKKDGCPSCDYKPSTTIGQYLSEALSHLEGECDHGAIDECDEFTKKLIGEAYRRYA